MKRLSALLLLVILAGCATKSPQATNNYGPGLLEGMWHGMLAPIALVGHIFDQSIAIYASPNSGWWYDFGFLVGLSLLWGGASSVTKK